MMMIDNTAATCNRSTIILIKSSKLMIIQLLQKFENLLFLKNTKFYCRWWNEFKIIVTKSSCIYCVIIDNKYIVKLIETVKTMMMINKKQQQFTAALIYMTVLQKSFSAWSRLSQECDISTCLIRKLIMICFDEAVSDHNQLILQVIENINKIKNSFIADKVIAARQLLSENVLIITDTAAIKKKLECDSI